MGDTIYVIHGFRNGCKQPVEVFVSEAHARLRAAYLGRLYDSVALGARRAGREAHGHGTRKRRGHKPEPLCL